MTTSTLITDKMRVKHAEQLDVHDGVVEDSATGGEPEPDLRPGHLTLMGFMFNGLTMSGGVHWCLPSTGRSIDRPKWSAELVDPSDELTGDQLCDCAVCLASDAP